MLKHHCHSYCISALDNKPLTLFYSMLFLAVWLSLSVFPAFFRHQHHRHICLSAATRVRCSISTLHMNKQFKVIRKTFHVNIIFYYIIKILGNGYCYYIVVRNISLSIAKDPNSAHWTLPKWLIYIHQKPGQIPYMRWKIHICLHPCCNSPRLFL